MICAMSTLAAVLVLSLGGTATESEAPITVAPGIEQRLHIAGLHRVAVAKPEVADVIAAGGDLLVLGKQKGRTSLTLWIEGRKPVTRLIVVDDNRTAELGLAIHRLVSPDLRVTSMADKIIVDGRVDSLRDLQRLRALVAEDPNVKLLVELNPSLMPVIAKEITESFHRQGLRDASAKAIGNRIVLEGSVTDPEEYKKAQLIADSYFALVSSNP